MDDYRQHESKEIGRREKCVNTEWHVTDPPREISGEGRFGGAGVEKVLACGFSCFNTLNALANLLVIVGIGR